MNIVGDDKSFLLIQALVSLSLYFEILHFRSQNENLTFVCVRASG